MPRSLARSFVLLFFLGILLVTVRLPLAAEGGSRQPAERREARPATQSDRGAAAPGTAAPTIGDAALSVDGDVHLDDASTLFKDGALFLWDDASNLALGRGALENTTTGGSNVAVGPGALRYGTTGSRNTAVGYQALNSDSNTGAYGLGFDNTAVGDRALYSNQASYSYDADAGMDVFKGSFNTAIGSQALFHNTTGRESTAVGLQALYSNTTGHRNTAVGRRALAALTVDEGNTAIGDEAMINVLKGDGNTAIGRHTLAGFPDGLYGVYQTYFVENVAVGNLALEDFSGGESNVAVGAGALQSLSTGNHNVALGNAALRGVEQGYSDNIGIGHLAGTATIHGNNILIGNEGVTDDANTIRLGNSSDHSKTYIAGVYPVTGDGTHYALVAADGQLSRGGAVASSARFKSAIHDMGGGSRGLFSLRPVTFHSELPAHRDEERDFGLIAEEVAQVLPELVLYDDAGRPSGVRYNALSSLLLNEVQRLHRQSRVQWVLLALLSVACLVALWRRRPI